MRGIGAAACAVLALVGGFAPAGAQATGGGGFLQGTGLQAPPTPGFAALVGAVDDSLRGGVLVGAHVEVVGSRLRATTNEAGLFRIDSLPPGDVQIRVRHPLLDSLQLTVTSAHFSVAADRVTNILVATPSVADFRERYCPRGRVTAGRAMVAGRVEDAESGTPLANAGISLLYIDSTGTTPSPRVRTARTNAEGFYAICSLPDELDATLQVTALGHTSPEVPVTTAGKPLVVAGFLLETRDEPDSTMSAVLAGKVVDVAGRPVADAQVAVEGGRSVARTAPDGTFRLAGLPSGTTNASVHKIGFAAAFEAVHLRKSEPQQLLVSLAAAARLPPVKVTASVEDGLKRVGFMDRMKIANPSGFISPADMKKFEGGKITDVFRTVPGFEVHSSGPYNQSYVQSTRALNPLNPGCVAIFVDKILFDQREPGDLDAAFPAYTIGAVETYASPADAPFDFRVNGRACATVVMWTKQRLNR